jgi:hypothetical protein
MLYAGAAAITIAALLAASAAMAVSPGSITEHHTRTFNLPPQRGTEFSVPFPDALKYGNSTYTGKFAVLAPKPGTKGRRPDLHKVRIDEVGDVLGGSAFGVRLANDNSIGTAAVRVRITAMTVEQLPRTPAKPCGNTCT